MTKNKNFRVSEDTAESFRKLSSIAEETQDKTMQKLLRCGELYELYERHPELKSILDAILDNWVGFSDSIKSLILVNENSTKSLENEYKDQLAANAHVITSLTEEKTQLSDKIQSLTDELTSCKNRIKDLEATNLALCQSTPSRDMVKEMMDELFRDKDYKVS